MLLPSLLHRDRWQVNRDHKKNDFFLLPRAAGLRKFKEEEVRHANATGWDAIGRDRF